MSKRYEDISKNIDIRFGIETLEAILETARIHHNEQGFSTQTLYPHDIDNITKLLSRIKPQTK